MPSLRAELGFDMSFSHGLDEKEALIKTLKKKKNEKDRE